jgi:uncharacterized membrane protein (UPF0127 family)
MIAAVLIGPRESRIGVRVAIARAERRRGLIGSADLAPAEGLLLPGTRSVHTFGLKGPITVVSLREDLSVLAVARVRPGRIVPPRAGTRHILELAEGADVRPLDRFRLAWGESSDQHHADDPEHRERQGGEDPDGERRREP